MRSLILLGLGLLFGAKAQCPPDFFTIENSCIQQCPSGYMTVGTSCQRCRLTFNGLCVDSCPLRTTQMGDQCVPGCGSMFILPDGNCATSCPVGTFASGQQCIPGCAPGTFSLPGSSGCVERCPTGTFSSGQQCIPGCAPGTYILATIGSCVDRCPEGTMLSGTMCVPNCPVGTVPMKDGCASPAEMCSKVITGSVFMGTTCKCPESMWMKRAMNGTVMGTCVVAPADMTAPLDCTSFVADSVFDRQIQSCTCGESAPSIVANIKDVEYPFRCSASEPSIISCNATSRFDLMEKGCKMIDVSPPLPSIPAFPSFTARPSIPAAPSFSSQPSIPGITPRPSPSAKPTQRTDVIWKPTASRPPLPSLRPLFTALRPTPMPTPWRPSKPLLDVVERPPYIESSVRFTGADETQMTRPEKLQDLQASLACSLRLPVENIRIQNITLTKMDGSRRTIRPDFTPLSSNGSATHCFTVARPALRRLQAVSASATVDYYIVDPSVEILSLTPEEFSAIVGTSSGVNAVAAGVGASGVSATSETTNTLASSTTTPEKTSLVGVIVGPLAAIAVIAMVGVGVVAVIQRRKRSRLVRPAAPVVIHPNPIQASGSARTMFAPSTTRTGV